MFDLISNLPIPGACHSFSHQMLKKHKKYERLLSNTGTAVSDLYFLTIIIFLDNLAAAMPVSNRADRHRSYHRDCFRL